MANLEALQLAAGALVALVEGGHFPGTARVTFKDEYAHLGTRTIDEILDITNDALGEWRTGDMPMNGTPIYIRTTQAYRYLPYKAASQQYKRGEKGRWQVMNEYGGWENSHPLGNEWSLKSPFLASTEAQS